LRARASVLVGAYPGRIDRASDGGCFRAPQPDQPRWGCSWPRHGGARV